MYLGLYFEGKKPHLLVALRDKPLNVTYLGINWYSNVQYGSTESLETSKVALKKLIKGVELQNANPVIHERTKCSTFLVNYMIITLACINLPWGSLWLRLDT